MELNGLKYLVVGAGFSGAVLAHKIAAELGEKVLVIDRRRHIGGNSYSEPDPETGIECHRYGSHIFHTSRPEVWAFLSRFCTLNHYRHRVLTTHRGRVYSMPINLGTINEFFGSSLSPAQAQELLHREIDGCGIRNPANLEEKAISLIGARLYQAFIKGYTMKQWEADPVDLPEEIITRLPVRFNYKTDYFNDPVQGIPLAGYADLFTRMLEDRNIEVRLGLDFFEMREALPADCRVLFTGPIDRFFDYRYGELGWRTLRFEREVQLCADFQGSAVMNYADAEVPFTRIHEFRHYHDERDYPRDRTVIYREYSTGIGAAADPYYPVNARRDLELLACYRRDAAGARNTLFCGRLGSYRYLDMDQAVAEALDLYEREIKPAALIELRPPCGACLQPDAAA